MVWRRQFRHDPWALLAVIILSAIVAWLSRDNPAPSHTQPPLATSASTVARVVDGDTLLMEDHSRVRLIGVDTPETKKENTPVQPWGPEASRFTRNLIDDQNGQVRLEFDREQIDQYGRKLAYVWVGDRLLNEELLRAGLARALFNHPYSPDMKDRFRRAQDSAKRDRTGIWSDASSAPRRQSGGLQANRPL
ncbi:MAG: thermonuclease family protein [Pirellulales bacterium]|nr:thermonuclease family protein [Pirellulales bacterium]